VYMVMKAYRSFATTVSQVKMCDFAEETFKEFYIRGSAHRASNLISVQQDAT